jgi:hypothetical protein
MRDPVLENDLRLIGLQVESWKKLHNFITFAFDKAKPIISVVQESQFTEIRSILLQESEYAFEELNLVEALSGKAMNVLRRATSIRGIRELSTDEGRRLELDWNAIFTKITVVQGQLKARRKELRSRSAFWESLARLFGRRTARS